MAYNNDLERAGVPSLTLGACRSADYESETLDFHQLDLTGADLIFQISEHPDPNAPLASCVVSHQTETKPYQDFIDE
ncbi:MAG: hypothetical protein HKN36_13830 [Hellea sp.]|nr:hypothetical protein [Hellea sp.]